MQSPRSERVLLHTLAAMQFTNIVDFMIVMPLGPQLMRLFEIGPGEFASIVSSYTITAGLSGIAGAFFLDRFDRKKALFWIYCGFIFGTFSCAFAPSYFTLLIARSVTGAFGGVIGSLVMSIVGDAIPAQRRGHAMGVVMTSFSLASVLGVPFALYLATLWGWHAPFIFLGALGILVLTVGMKVLPSLSSHIQRGSARENIFAILPEIARNPNQLWALCLGAMLMLGHFTVVVFFSPAMSANVGFSDQELTYIYFFGGLATYFSSPWIGRAADRFGALQVFTVAVVLSAIPTFIVTNMGRTHIAPALLVSTAFFILGTARMVPMTTMVTGTVEPRRRGGFMSLYNSLQHLFIGISTTVAGMIVTTAPDGRLEHLERAGYLAIGTSFVCIWIARRVARVSQPIGAAAPIAPA
jgi:predicted MFS family arabinose efflux permease